MFGISRDHAKTIGCGLLGNFDLGLIIKQLLILVPGLIR